MKLSGQSITRFTAIFLLIASARVAGTQQVTQSDPASWSREQKAQFLLKADIISQRELGDGVTLSKRATLRNELGTHDAHIQTIDDFRAKFETAQGMEFGFKDSYKFNIAAYILDRILDLNMIPVTVERRVGGKPAAVTWWIDNIMINEEERRRDKIEPPDPEKWNEAIHIMLVFDQLIDNVDRNMGNMIITKNWDLWMIDHTRAFRTSEELRASKNLVRCDRDLLQGLRGLTKAVLKEKAGKYLIDWEIDGLLARRNKIVKFFDDKIAKEGENEVLYSYLAERRKLNR